jgi:hypothetical protein
MVATPVVLLIKSVTGPMAVQSPFDGRRAILASDSPRKAAAVWGSCGRAAATACDDSGFA